MLALICVYLFDVYATVAGGGLSGQAGAVKPFNGIWVPLVTPFHQGAVDLPALQHLVQHLAAQGVAGFVACGSTGEAGHARL